MKAPAIVGLSHEDRIGIHRSVLESLNQVLCLPSDQLGDLKVRPIYTNIDRDLLGVRREDGQPFDEDQQTDLGCTLHHYAHSVDFCNDDRWCVVLIRREGDAAEDARGDRFLRTLRGENKQHSRFRVQRADEFASGSPPEFIVDDVMPRGELGFVSGVRSSWKSFLTIDLLSAISLGKPWFGHDVVKGRCAYVVAEGAAGFKLRLRAHAIHHGVLLSELPRVIPAAPNLLSDADVRDLITALAEGSTDDPFAERQWDVIAIDTMAQVMPGGDENGSKDMGKLIANIKKIHAATGAMVLLVAHLGKDTSRGIRGWSGVEGAADMILEVTRSNDRATVCVEKAKDAADKQQHTFRTESVQVGISPKGKPLTSLVVVPIEGPTKDRYVDKRKRPRQGTALILLQTMERRWPTAAPLIEEVREEMREHLEHSVDKPDRSTEYLNKAISKLADTEADKWLWRHPGGRISLKPCVEELEGAWKSE